MIRWNTSIRSLHLHDTIHEARPLELQHRLVNMFNMLVLKTLFIFGVFLLKMASSEFQCCTQALANGSMAYTLNDTIPEDWTIMWSLDNTVIVSEGAEIDPAHVVSQTKNGYILRNFSSNVVCSLESPGHGVSERINCTDPCNSSARTADNSTENKIFLSCIVFISVFGILVIGVFIYKWYRRSHCHDNSGDVEMPLNVQDQIQNQNQDQNQDQEDHQRLY